MASTSFRPSLAQNQALLRMLRSFLVKVRAGLSVRRALSALASEVRDRSLREACRDLEAQVAEGCPLSLAMHGAGSRFGVMTPYLVEKGERHGSLAAGVEDAVAFLEGQNNAEDRFVRSVVRPIHILSYFFVALYIVVVVMAFLAEGFLTKGRPTDALSNVETLALTTSSVLRQVAPYVGGVGAILFSILHLGPRVPWVRIHFERLAFSMPYVSGMVRTQARACLAQALGIGYEAGISPIPVMEAAARSARFSLAGASIARAAEKLRRGKLWDQVFLEDGFLRKRDLPAAQAAMNKGAGRAFWLELARALEDEAAKGFRAWRVGMDVVSILVIALCAGAAALTLYVPLFVLR